MSDSTVNVGAILAGADDRYHRQTLIDWWDQGRVADARVLVVGAGALGNEILKCLALTGIGRTLVLDMDAVEHSNLSRSVLFRAGDEGRDKAPLAAERMTALNPDITAVGLRANVLHDIGLGVFTWADVVICGLDNREARLFVNGACARSAKPWVDGAIEALSGIVRVFEPATGPCYECTMGAVDRRIVAQRRSCAMLARQAAARGHVPTTAVSASLVGALQVQEAIKLVHGQPGLRGEGVHINGLSTEFSRVGYPRRPECTGHDALPEITPLGLGVADITASELLARAESALGEGACIDLSRDLIHGLQCPACGVTERVGAVVGAIDEQAAACPKCGAHRIVHVTSSLSRDGDVALDRTLADLGLPPYDIVTVRRGLEGGTGWLFDGDAACALGPLNRARKEAS